MQPDDSIGPAAAASTVPTATPATVPGNLTPLIRIEREDLGNIVLVNAGVRPIVVSEILFAGNDSGRYVARPAEPLEPSATLGLALEALDPVPPKELSGQLAVTYTAQREVGH